MPFSLTVETLELNTFFDEHDVMISSVSSWGLCSVQFLIILKCSLLLVSNHINYGARLGHYFCLYHWWEKMSASNLICSFPVIQWHWGSGLLHHQTPSLWIQPIRRLSVSYWSADWHWCCFSCYSRYIAVYAHTTTALIDIITSLQDTDGEVIPVSEMHESSHSGQCHV